MHAPSRGLRDPRLHTLLALIVAPSVFAGCSSDTLAPGTPTYHADIAPLIQRECLSCHVEGGIGPFLLDSYDDLRENVAIVVSAVESGYMPPWQPDRSCGDFANERGLSEDERAMIRAWNMAGTPEGRPSDAPPPIEVPNVVLDATHSAQIEAYVPDVEKPDDYRCFILDMSFDEPMFLTGSEVVPGLDDLVHHVLVYALTPEELAIAEMDDANDPGPGYTCFGGPLPSGGLESNLANQIGAWVPGLQPDIFADGQAIRIEAGGKIVVQVHYNTLAGELREDTTEFRARLSNTAPTTLVSTVPLPILDLEIDAGDEESRHSRIFRNYRDEPISIRSMTAHMHLIGTQFEAQKLPAEDASDAPQCMLDIPEWDFNWQQGYLMNEPMVIEPGEGVQVTCTYDNSETNQPIVNGVQVEPRDVRWGEGTLDEMCILYIRQEQPYVEPEMGPTCAAAAECRADCGDSIECLFECEELDRACLNCATYGIVDCASLSCAPEFIAIQRCLMDCVVNVNVLGGSVDTCLEVECSRRYDMLKTCVDPILESGECDEDLSACGEGLVD